MAGTSLEIVRPVPPPAEAGAQVHAWAMGALRLESGVVLPQVTVTFETWGVLSAAGDNAVLVVHALTGDSHVVGGPGPGQPTAGWWPGSIGEGCPLDPARDFVVCVNVLGGCRGTTGPVSPHPDGQPWGSRWPRVTIRDQVYVETAVADLLGVRSWRLVVGGSMGGMRVLEWVATHPDRVRAALVLASTPWATADQIAWGQAQRLAITGDPDYRGGDYLAAGVAPAAGLGLARRIAHTTYRSAAELNHRFGAPASRRPDPADGAGDFAVESYLDHHAAKLSGRFDAGAYLALTDAMATHDLTRGRGTLAEVLAGYDGVLRVAAVDTDRLFQPALSQAVIDAAGRGRLDLIRSACGHDGFLIERDQVDALVRSTLAELDAGELDLAASGAHAAVG